MSLNYVTMPETLAESNANLFSDSKISEYVKEISKIKPLTIEQEQELAKKAKEGHQWAKNALVQANLKLVISIARKVIHSSKLPMVTKFFNDFDIFSLFIVTKPLCNK